MRFFKKKKTPVDIFAPVDGKIIKLEDVDDEVFSKKMLGDGFAFKPTGKTFYAPMTGSLETVYGHAYGIKHHSGVTLLLHIGDNTVALKGEGFNVAVVQGDKVNQGDKLVEVDLVKIAKEKDNIKIDTPLVFMQQGMENRKIILTVKPNTIVKANTLVATIE